MRRAVSLAALLFLLAAAAPAAAAVPRNWLGVDVDGPMTDGTDRDGEWALIPGAGATTVRTAFYWSQGQPTGPASTDFSRTDRVVLTAARHGLGVFPVVLGTPGWAAAVAGVGGSPPRHGTDYGRYLQALVGRYGPHGTLWTEHPEVTKRAIRDWQIWNEPNIDRYWSKQPFAKSYVRVLRAARTALRKADPGSRAILAGLPNKSWSALRSIYIAGGRGAFDAVALHPYTGKPSNVIKLIKLTRRVMSRYRDSRKRVWVSELSWPASVGKTTTTGGFETNDKGQAQRLRKGLMLLAHARRKLRIERVYWYTWLSVEQGPNSFGWSGLRRIRGGQVISAPSLSAFRQTAKLLRR
jgi:hypothetical protein